MKLSDILLTHYTKDPFVLHKERQVLYQQSDRDLKPKGLWLSDDSDYGWAEWCRGENWRTENLTYRTEFKIKPESNILHLSTADECIAFSAEYKTELQTIDWVAVAQKYDGIIVTPYPRYAVGFNWFYAWDCSSGCFWNLDNLELIGGGPNAV